MHVLGRVHAEALDAQAYEVVHVVCEATANVNLGADAESYFFSPVDSNFEVAPDLSLVEVVQTQEVTGPDGGGVAKVDTALGVMKVKL